GASDGSRKNRRHCTVVQKGIEAKSAYRHRLNRRYKIGHRCIGRPLYQRRCQAPRRSFFSTGSTDGASEHTIGALAVLCTRDDDKRPGEVSSAPVQPTVHRSIPSVHWPSFIPETMSSAQKKFLQHRFNRRYIGAYHRCNDVSVQEKIPSAPVEPVRHRCKASVQPVVTASAVRTSTATSCCE